MRSQTGERPIRTEWILSLAGFCLILLQFFMIREVTALLRGTELVILLVTLAYFIGYSVGYGAARWLTIDRIRNVSLLAWALHLTLPFSFRLAGGFLWQKTAGIAFVVLLFLTAFALSSFYSVLLPRFIDERADNSQSLVRLYGWELLGAIVGLCALLAVARIPWATPVLYQASLAALVALLWARPIVVAVACVVVIVYVFAFPSVEKHSLRYRFAAIHGFPNVEVLYSVNTLYQKVDMFRDADGRRHIYLSGRQNYGSDELVRFNTCLSRVPALLVRPREALIIGSGSMQSVRHVSEFAEHVTTCELDAAVIEGSRRFFADVNQLDRIANWTLFIDDAKQFLGRTGKRFDLIVMDVPAPATIQLGLLHSEEFYRLARQRLTSNGVISVSLCDTLTPSHETARAIVAGLMKAFPNVQVYTPAESGWSFALAGDNFPFTTEQLRETVLSAGANDVVIPQHAGIEEMVADMQPISVNRMQVVLQRSWDHLTDFYLPEVLR